MTSENNNAAIVSEGQQTVSRLVTGQSRHSRHYRASRYKKRADVLAVLLGLSVFVLFAVSLAMVVQLAKLTSTKNLLREGLVKAETELEQLRMQLDETQQELTSVIEGRFPNLMPLKPDRVVDVRQHYVKNIVFTVLNNGSDKIYEYKVVMENKYDYPVFPDVRLLVFDKMGIQTGVDDIRDEQELAPGESRSFSQSIDVFMNSDPSYFTLDFRTAKEQQKRIVRG